MAAAGPPGDGAAPGPPTTREFQPRETSERRADGGLPAAPNRDSGAPEEPSDGHAGDSARAVWQSLTDEHDRVAGNLNDTIVRQMFAVSMHLHIALTRIDDAHATERICHAIGGLDEAIKDLRLTIFGFHQSELGPRPSPCRHQQRS
ncbi:histidine kinase [Actinoallomurus sp. NPDC052308]|uniref:histidine kinase n=1 Tax=Actinoallomurus sp. NPDC052308 TaxID=3155530 RepID=UPI00342B0E79